eukprot:CCRYP_006225-RA/>CCRYP_006225-RA protein AED:0.44 eAED:0.69 QI:317/0/0.5/1/0/0/2/0/102
MASQFRITDSIVANLGTLLAIRPTEYPSPASPSPPFRLQSYTSTSTATTSRALTIPPGRRSGAARRHLRRNALNRASRTRRADREERSRFDRLARTDDASSY